MKVTPSIRPICDHCKVVRKQGRVMVVCKDGGHPSSQKKHVL